MTSNNVSNDEQQKLSTDDTQQNHLDGVDLASVFPTSKIKAQILRDEGVGRVSSKAIHFIGACSALFLRQLAESAKYNATGSSSSLYDGDSSSSRSSRKRKADQRSGTHSKSDRGSAVETTTTGIVTRDHVKACIEQDSTAYDFLNDLLSQEVSARDTPGYGAAYRNKRKRETVNAGKKGKKGANKKEEEDTAAVGVRSVLGGSSAGTDRGSKSGADAVVAGDEEETLRSVIDLSMQEGNTFGMDEIVEDDEEYD